MKNMTPKQAARYFKGKDLKYRFGDIQVIRKTCERNVWIDNRTVHTLHLEPACVFPFALDSSHVYIICPYCQTFHVHSNKQGDYGGMRVSHCHIQRHPDYNIMPI